MGKSNSKKAEKNYHVGIDGIYNIYMLEELKLLDDKYHNELYFVPDWVNFTY